MRFHDVVQGTDEWKQLRLGKFTASRFADLFMGKSTAGYKKAIYRVAYERLYSEEPESEYQSAYMKRGNEVEPEARAAYELHTFTKVSNGGFFEFDDWTGGSPDGLIETEGQLQIKCVAYNTQIEYLKAGVLPGDYTLQVNGEMYVTGRAWVDFFSWHPKLPPFIIRVERDEKIMQQLNAKLAECKREVESVMSQIQKWNNG